jgi:hypothetical protein
MYAAYASVMGIPLSKVEVRLKGYLDKRGMLGMDGAVPSGFQKVSYEVTIDSVHPQQADRDRGKPLPGNGHIRASHRDHGDGIDQR